MDQSTLAATLAGLERQLGQKDVSNWMDLPAGPVGRHQSRPRDPWGEAGSCCQRRSSETSRDIVSGGLVRFVPRRAEPVRPVEFEKHFLGAPRNFGKPDVFSLVQP